MPWAKQLMFLVGMPVEVRQSEKQCRPWTVHLLAGCIALVSVAVWLTAGRWSGWQLAVYDPLATGWRTYTGLVGYAFIHADWLHLLGNLYFLLIFGDNTECAFGRRRTLGLFFAASVAGAVLHGVFSEAPLVGASAGVMGVMVFYALQFPQARVLWLPLGWVIRVGLWVYWRRRAPRGFPVLGFLAFYLLLELITLHAQLFGEGRVSALAHFGGAGLGALIWLGWRRGWLP